ncbi:Fanconi anemia group F protein [Ambystoma mexicanum]|uniref:Fanconi anemia group F protein n=1 Tax=Ambystoma mexicanum TaxID=8296 RepID=UPI0037E90367
MEAILQHLEQFAEMLTICRSEQVKSWDSLTAQRAFQWAGYFQHLHHRFHTNISVRTAMEQRLCDINQLQIAAAPRDPPLCFDNLGCCPELLWDTLLQNPALPSAVCQHLLSELNEESSGGITANVLFRTMRQKNAAGILHSVISRDIPCKIELPSISIGNTEICCYSGGNLELPHCSDEKAVSVLYSGGKKEQLSCSRVKMPFGAQEKGTKATVYYDSCTVSPVTKTHACVLSKHLKDKVKCVGVSDSADLITMVNEVMAQIPRPYVFVLVALLLTSSKETAHLNLLKQWLLGDPNLQSCFYSSVDCELLINLSLKYPEFRNAHLKLLAEWGRNLEYNIGSRQWTSTSSEVSWERLQHHFSCLLGGPPDTQEAAESTLRTLITKEGGFSVKGISVWTDLLLCLRPGFTF